MFHPDCDLQEPIETLPHTQSLYMKQDSNTTGEPGFLWINSPCSETHFEGE